MTEAERAGRLLCSNRAWPTYAFSARQKGYYAQRQSLSSDDTQEAAIVSGTSLGLGKEGLLNMCGDN